LIRCSISAVTQKKQQIARRNILKLTNGSSKDLVWDHPFGFDYWFSLATDAPYLALLNDRGIFGKADCSKEGIAAGGGDQDTCTAFQEEQANRVPSGVLHTEMEDRLVPEQFRPVPGDRVYMRGRRIVDCGHDNFTAEIHPPTLLAKASVDDAGAVHSTVITIPYETIQRYFPNNNTFQDQVQKIIAQDSVLPVGIPLVIPLAVNPFEFYAQTGVLPFHQLVHARYQIVLPPRADGIRAKLFYHFEARLGVTVRVSQPFPPEADVDITLDPTKYATGVPPTCQSENWTLGELDQQANLLDGTIRGIVTLGGVLLPPGVLYAAEHGMNVLHCDVPHANPISAPEGILDNIVATSFISPYPVYGWLTLKWDNPPMLLTVSTVGNGTVIGPNIKCPVACSSSYPRWTQVKLTAKASPGATFERWEGDCQGMKTCFVTMDSPGKVNAVFTQGFVRRGPIRAAPFEVVRPPK
jgi:hypothetical protein